MWGLCNICSPCYNFGEFEDSIFLFALDLSIRLPQLLGVEIPQEFGGAGLSFMTDILIVEEIAKVDPSLSVLVDIQNTLVNDLIIKLGTAEQKAKYLPRLALTDVGEENLNLCSP